MPTARLIAATFALALLLSSCAANRTGPRPESRSAAQVITAEEIQALGVRTAWEAIRRSATHLVFRQDTWGNTRRVYHRGMNSMRLDVNPIFVLDGHPLTDYTVLQSVPASSLQSITILTGAQATTRFGTNAGNGAILVETQRGAAQ